MCQTRSFVIPESWTEEASVQINELNRNEALYSIIPVLNFEKLSKSRLRTSIVKVLRASPAQNAVVVLPKTYAAGGYIRYWPDMFICRKSGVIITSVLFADKWSECSKIVFSWADIHLSKIHKHNATCQYQPPYTDLLEQWIEKGAQGYHPGDYFKCEFLSELMKMQGHWLYWGHSDGEELHGYDHLTSEDIVRHKPVSPLQSTLWFSCSTLAINKKSSIALDWYLNGATYCLFASMGPVKTIDNQLLSTMWLKVCGLLDVTSIADVIRKLLIDDQKVFQPILNSYRLLGLPWVNFV